MLAALWGAAAAMVRASHLRGRQADAVAQRSAKATRTTAVPDDRVQEIRAAQDLLRRGFPDEAASRLQLVVERFPDPGPALPLLARAEFARGRVAEAFVAAGRALARQPDDRATARLRALSAEVLSFGPEQPRSARQGRRAHLRALLQRARASLVKCQAADPSLVAAIDGWLRAAAADEDLGRGAPPAAATRVDGGGAAE
ncbi:hypothetical protein TBR22_A17420 [Luteitalea sp. TBR-22]|nr:hypothetical protein TBR22_A17420 [Luteitalea sp. TBR-22]